MGTDDYKRKLFEEEFGDEKDTNKTIYTAFAIIGVLIIVASIVILNAIRMH